MTHLTPTPFCFKVSGDVVQEHGLMLYHWMTLHRMPPINRHGHGCSVAGIPMPVEKAMFCQYHSHVLVGVY
jgi:hypothetical protein